eukprot:SM000117S25471  [mRNA]  locus=s117:40520:44208:- [translate_table: standard]
MGLGPSKDEQLYNCALRNEADAVKALRHQDASMEWRDKKSRTALMVCSAQGESFEMVALLLQLGADVNAYRPGHEGGYPLHHAAKKGMDRTCHLLMSYGAPLMVFNDDGQTPLDMARERGHVAVVRLLEDRICLFQGYVRQQVISGPALLEAFAANLCFRRIWLVVLPASTSAQMQVKYELLIYKDQKATVPTTVLALETAQFTVARPGTSDPVLLVTDTVSRTKYKLLADKESSDPNQFQRLFDACRGIAPRPGSGPAQHVTGFPINNLSSARAGLVPLPGRGGAASPSQPTALIADNTFPPPTKTATATQEEMASDDLALAMAIDASLRMASEQGVVASSPPELAGSGPHSGSARSNSYQGWAQGPGMGEPSTYGGWDEDLSQAPSMDVATSGAGGTRPGITDQVAANSPGHGLHAPSTFPDSISGWVAPTTSEHVTEVSAAELPRSAGAGASLNQEPPSAPPLPEDLSPAYSIPEPAVQYPSVDMTPVDMVDSMGATGAPSGGEEPKKGGQCIVCWDAPASVVCIPCGHVAGCMACLSEIKDKGWGCPVCRAPIRDLLKVYQV